MDKQAGQVELVAQRRDMRGKQVKQLRRAGMIPGVVYGHGFEPIAIQLELRPLQHVLSQISGSQLVSLKVEGQEQPEMVLVRDVQVEAINRHLVHIDLYRVSMTERLRTEVRLILVGEAPAVRRNEGILLHGISSVEVQCLPGDLPDAITVDLASLNAVEDAIFVRDLPVPRGVEILTDGDEMIVRVGRLEMKAEAELEVAPVAEAAAEVETVREAKTKEQEGEEEAA